MKLQTIETNKQNEFDSHNWKLINDDKDLLLIDIDDADVRRFKYAHCTKCDTLICSLKSEDKYHISGYNFYNNDFCNKIILRNIMT